MKRQRQGWIPVMWIGLLFAVRMYSQAPSGPAVPHLEKRGGSTQLIVDGKPFLILGGELENNSATSLEYMEPRWAPLRKMNLNTVLAAVSWAMLEPSEGKFDFSLVEGLIRAARDHNLRLVLLWFGSWKNTWSSYAPDWVKRDFARFPRVQLGNGAGTERLSPFSEANRAADSTAFAAFMKRIREVDQAHTVILVQVENEVGVIPDARDHSPAANASYSGPVPKELLDYLEQHRETLAPELRKRWQDAGLKSSGDWETVFGPGPETEHLFMSWHYAQYIGEVAAAGKAQYNLPMFTNAALIRPGYAAGQYNSGGPVGASLDVWKAGAPQLDLLAPDIYFEFRKWCAAYHRPDNPLFIPEAAGGYQGAAGAFYAIGQHAALGFSPFAIDAAEYAKEENDALAASDDVLSQLAPLILEHQTRKQTAAVLLEELTPSQNVRLGDYTLRVVPAGLRRLIPAGPVSQPLTRGQVPHGIFIAAAPDEFYLAGSGLNITFSPNTPGPPIAGLATVEEGRFVNGQWRICRTLAGDDTGQGNNIALRGAGPCPIQHVSLYRYR